MNQREIDIVIRARDESQAALRSAGAGIVSVGNAATGAYQRLFAYGAAFETAGRTLRNFGLIAGAVAGVSIKMAADFEGDMGLVRTQAKLTDTEFDNLSQSVLHMSVATGKSTGELAEGLYDIFSSIQATAPQAEKALGLVAKAAVAGATDIRSASRGAIGILNAYGLSIDNLGHVLDIQFALVRTGVGTYEEFTQAIGKLSPSAVAAGQTLESMAGILAFATRNGLNATVAVTATARALDLITRPGIAQKLRDNLGVDIVDPATGNFKQLDQIMTEMATTGGLGQLTKPQLKEKLVDLFGQGDIRAMRFLNVAIPRFKELSRVMEEVAGPKSAGAMLDAFELMADTGAVQVDILMASLKALAIEFGTSLMPILREVVRVAEDLFSWFNNLSDGTKTFIGQVTALSAVVGILGGILLSFIGKWLRVLAFLARAGTSVASILGPMGALIGALTLLIGIFAAVVGHGNKMIGTIGHMAIVVGGLLLAFTALKVIPGILLKIAVGFEALGAAKLSQGILSAGAAVEGFSLGVGRLLGPMALLVGGTYAASKATEGLGFAANLGIDALLTLVNPVVGLTKAFFDLSHGTVKAADDMIASSIATAERLAKDSPVSQLAINDTRIAMDQASAATLAFGSANVRTSDNVKTVWEQLADDANLTSDEIIAAFKKQLHAMSEYEGNWDKLIGRGIPEALRVQLADMGLKGAGIVEALANANEADFKRIIKQFNLGIGVVDNYSGALNGIPKEIHTTVYLSGVNVPDVKVAAKGFEGMVYRPTMFLAGEAGAEYVSVTPNSKVNKSVIMDSTAPNTQSPMSVHITGVPTDDAKKIVNEIDWYWRTRGG